MRIISMLHPDLLRRRGGLTCLQSARIVQRYLDAELDDRSSALVEGHLEACHRCGLDARAYREIKAALRQRSQAPPPEQVHRLAAFVADLAAADGPGAA